MQQWEYLYIYVDHGRTNDDKMNNEKFRHIPQTEAVLNGLGAQGWEVVGQTAWGSHQAEFTLKRPKP